MCGILTQHIMFKLYFYSGVDCKEFKKDMSSLFAETKTDLEAVQLALALHQSSNIPHFVIIEDIGGVQILSLNLVK